LNKALLLSVLVVFGVFTLEVMWQVGYMGIWRAGTASPGALQVLIDLIIVCTLAVIWIVQDARNRGLNPWPFVAITLAAGSFGPLLYLLRREWAARFPAQIA
jgi:Ca2+/Na+ antiporter